MIRHFITLAVFLAAPTLASADPATVHNVKVSKSAGTFTFNVTIRHKDTGWEDYADIWRIKDENGTVLGQRVLAHPHVNEQPFTRSLSGVKIPEGTKSVLVEVHDTVTGWAPTAKKVALD